MEKKVIEFVMGLTNAGKSTYVIRQAAAGIPVVMVGRMMRAKHPPEFFKGRAEMPETEPEVRELLVTGITQGLAESARVAVDGQPRNVGQLDLIRAAFPGVDKTYHVFIASEAERTRRAITRDTGAALDLSLARMGSELPAYVEVLHELIRNRMPCESIVLEYEDGTLRHL